MSEENLNEVVNQPVAEEQQVEKMVPQSKVNNLIREATARAYEKAQQENMPASSNQMSSPSPGMNEEQIRQMMAQEAESHYSKLQEAQRQEAEKQQMQQLANEFIGKLQQGTDKYDDFEQVITDIGLSNYPQLVAMSNQFDNVPDIMYELGKNPAKIGSLMALAYTNPQLALKEMRNLSESIKNNESAKRQYSASPNPLMQMKPTIKSGDNGGQMSVSDLRRHPAFKA